MCWHMFLRSSCSDSEIRPGDSGALGLVPRILYRPSRAMSCHGATGEQNVGLSAGSTRDANLMHNHGLRLDGGPLSARYLAPNPRQVLWEKMLSPR
jgi:hypothetical protein